MFVKYFLGFTEQSRVTTTLQGPFREEKQDNSFFLKAYITYVQSSQNTPTACPLPNPQVLHTTCVFLYTTYSICNQSGNITSSQVTSYELHQPLPSQHDSALYTALQYGWLTASFIHSV